MNFFPASYNIHIDKYTQPPTHMRLYYCGVCGSLLWSISDVLFPSVATNKIVLLPEIAFGMVYGVFVVQLNGRGSVFRFVNLRFSVDSGNSLLTLFLVPFYNKLTLVPCGWPNDSLHLLKRRWGGCRFRLKFQWLFWLIFRLHVRQSNTPSSPCGNSYWRKCLHTEDANQLVDNRLLSIKV